MAASTAFNWSLYSKNDPNLFKFVAEYAMQLLMEAQSEDSVREIVKQILRGHNEQQDANARSIRREKRQSFLDDSPDVVVKTSRGHGSRLRNKANHTRSKIRKARKKKEWRIKDAKAEKSLNDRVRRIMSKAQELVAKITSISNEEEEEEEEENEVCIIQDDEVASDWECQYDTDQEEA